MGAFIWPMLTLIFSEKLGYTPTQTVTFLVEISVIFLVANIVGGKLADKFNRKKIIITFDIISVLFFFACAFVSPGNLMIIFFVISGVFATAEGPAFDALIAESTLPAEREKVFSLAYLGFNLGFIFGSAIAGLLFTNYLSLAFILDGTTTIISTLMIIIFVKVYKQEDMDEKDKNEYETHYEEKHKITALLKTRKSLLFYILIASLGAFIYDQWTFILPLYMSHIYGDNGAKYFGFVSSFNGFCVILFTPILTYLLRKKFELQKLMLGAFLLGLSYIIIRNATVLIVFFAFMMLFTFGEIINSIGGGPYMSRRIPGSHRGRLASIAYIGFFIGSMGGKYLSGIIIDNYGYNAVLTMMFIVGIVSSILMYFNYRLDRKIFPKLYIVPPQIEQNEIKL